MNQQLKQIPPIQLKQVVWTLTFRLLIAILRPTTLWNTYAHCKSTPLGLTNRGQNYPAWPTG